MKEGRGGEGKGRRRRDKGSERRRRKRMRSTSKNYAKPQSFCCARNNLFIELPKSAVINML